MVDTRPIQVLTPTEAHRPPLKEMLLPAPTPARSLGAQDLRSEPKKLYPERTANKRTRYNELGRIRRRTRSARLGSSLATILRSLKNGHLVGRQKIVR